MRKGILAAFVFVCICSVDALTQSFKAAKQGDQKKNIIKLNLSSTVLYHDSPLIEYERVTKPNQSFSIQTGLVSLPFGNRKISNSINFISTKKKRGFTVTGDYRFYLPTENKDPAPHGVYIGPYLSIFSFSNLNDLTVKDNNNNTANLSLKSDLNAASLGFQLGYQFLLGKRWTIDCLLFGPSITNYKLKMQFEGDVSNINVDDKVKEIAQKLVSLYPAIGSLLDNQLVEFKGNTNTFGAGFRYSLHVGFRF